ncbi:MAG: hypothetical protein IM582_06430 [Chitinophagaceae bacterium]|nr:hypothetical protein [Chitinophagaceae bacterium]MCA6452803.1 hypothetical protein [Chitinophagaceae bacterium]MCA6458393.1 hypothetical protein [Chitinophagaceae bacterium]
MATITPSGATTFCSGGTVSLTGGGGVSYIWSTGSTLSTISVASSGSITVTATDVNGCKNTSSVTNIIVNPLPTITAPSAICVGAPTVLTGSGLAAVTSPWQSSNLLIASINTAGVVTGWWEVQWESRIRTTKAVSKLRPSRSMDYPTL